MTPDLRLMTANLLHERADVEQFADLLDRVDPDVLVAQELGPECAEVVAARYPTHRLRPARDFSGRGIASRFDAELGDIEMPVRDATWGFLDVDGRLLRVVGMHLVNAVAFPWWRSAVQRKRQLQALFGWADATDLDIPLVVAGDLNASPRWPAYSRLAERWDDLAAGHASETGSEPPRTWSWRPGWPLLLRIDHVFGSGVTASEVWSEPIEGSDHRALVADLHLDDRPG